jgi:hypothetical protein
MNNSNWTGRTNRTLEDAFGPHTSRKIDAPMHWQDRVTTWASAVALVAFIGIMFIWG